MTQAVEALSVAGIFEPLMEEFDYVAGQIDGTLPAELKGTLYRIGAGKWQVGSTLTDHLFDADGMVSQFVLDGRSVRFRNRYVRTESFRHGTVSDKIRYPGVGTKAPGLRLRSLPGQPANFANTNLLHHAGELLALWEGGHPHRLDPDTLETLGLYDFEGALGRFQTFSAHPKRDPATGEWFNFGFRLFPWPRLVCHRVDRRGRLHRLASVPMRQMPLNHDMALSQRHLVFVLDPHLLNMRKVIMGETAMDAFTFHPDKSTRFLLVPRDGGPPRIAEHEAMFHFHVTNAFEDGADTVVDLVRFDDLQEVKRVLREFRTMTDVLPTARLMRYRITPSGRVIEERLATHSADFPQLDQRVTTRRHRYTYLAGLSGAAAGILKIDHDTETVARHQLGADTAVGEPIFVPRTSDAAEDDGWLLAVNYVAAEHRSQLLILDAADPDREPVAVVQLPHHLPFGFHGTFTHRVAAPGSPIPHPDRLNL